MPNKKTNQKCWNCDHFQRYEDSEQPQTEYGECRRKPLNTQYGQIGSDSWVGWWPFIEQGTNFWCGSWQHSVQPVPDPPEFPRPPIWPDVWEQWTPWNKKESQNVECWNCNHFQPDSPTKSLLGECRRLPPPEVIDIQIAPNLDVTLQGVKTKICGDTRWCGMWEASEEPVPDKPSLPGSCFDKPPSQPSSAVDEMTKAELIEYAGENEISINSSDTKAKILAAIKSS